MNETKRRNDNKNIYSSQLLLNKIDIQERYLKKNDILKIEKKIKKIMKMKYE